MIFVLETGSPRSTNRFPGVDSRVFRRIDASIFPCEELALVEFLAFVFLSRLI